MDIETRAQTERLDLDAKQSRALANARQAQHPRDRLRCMAAFLRTLPDIQPLLRNIQDIDPSKEPRSVPNRLDRIYSSPDAWAKLDQDLLGRVRPAFSMLRSEHYHCGTPSCIAGWYWHIWWSPEHPVGFPFSSVFGLLEKASHALTLPIGMLPETYWGEISADMAANVCEALADYLLGSKDPLDVQEIREAQVYRAWRDAWNSVHGETLGCAKPALLVQVGIDLLDEPYDG